VTIEKVDAAALAAYDAEPFDASFAAVVVAVAPDRCEVYHRSGCGLRVVRAGRVARTIRERLLAEQLVQDGVWSKSQVADVPVVFAGDHRFPWRHDSWSAEPGDALVLTPRRVSVVLEDADVERAFAPGALDERAYRAGRAGPRELDLIAADLSSIATARVRSQLSNPHVEAWLAILECAPESASPT
jgi:hypothetical protein